MNSCATPLSLPPPPTSHLISSLLQDERAEGRLGCQETAVARLGVEKASPEHTPPYLGKPAEKRKGLENGWRGEDKTGGRRGKKKGGEGVLMSCMAVVV